MAGFSEKYQKIRSMELNTYPEKSGALLGALAHIRTRIETEIGLPRGPRKTELLDVLDYIDAVAAACERHRLREDTFAAQQAAVADTMARA